MARKPLPKGKNRRDEAPEALRRAAPPPAGLPIMPRVYDVGDIRDDGGTFVDVKANEAECAAIAEAYHLPALAALSARYNLRKHGKRVSLTGTLKAHLTQDCVVTMEPFESEVSEPVEMEYAPEHLVAEVWERIAKAEASGTNAPVEDPPDVIVEDKIDLGALTVEALALSLDPYPKKPGVEFETHEEEDETSLDDSPFAVLARLRAQGGPEGKA